MTLVIIFGPPAVGKMTVGLALKRLTGFGLFHNHMSVDPVMRLFPFESPAYTRLVTGFRERVFEEYAAHDSPGLIFTFAWALDDPQDRAFVDRTIRTFADQGAGVCFVELEATQAERLRRNKTPLRMAEKRPQRDTAGSQAFLLEADRTCRLNTRGDFPYPQQHLKVDNTDMEPEVVAHRIVEHFRLTRIGGVTLRQAAASDAEAIHELHLDSVRTLCASSYTPEILEAWLKDRTADSYLHGIETGATFVAEIGSTTVGFCEAIAGEVVAVFVSPQYAGRSVGTALVSLALDIATRGRRLVQLESTLNAVPFYTRFGFRQMGGSTVRRNGVDIPVVLMQRSAGWPARAGAHHRAGN